MSARCRRANPPAQGDEPAPGELRRQLEIERAEPEAEVGVVLRLEVEARRLADPALLAIVVLVPADGHAVVGEVGDIESDALELGPKLGEPGLRGLQLVAEPRHVGQQRLDVLAFRLRAPYRLRTRVALVLQRLGASLDVLALVLEPADAGGIEFHPPRRQPGRRRFEIASEKCRIEHGVVFAPWSPRAPWIFTVEPGFRKWLPA